MAEQLIRPERLMELAGLTSSDVDSDQLDACIKHFSITEKSLDGMSQSELSKELLEILNTDYLSIYDYIWKSPETVKYSAKQQPLSLSVFSMSDVLCTNAFIDFAQGEIYADTARWVFSNIHAAGIQRHLDQELMNSILDSLTSGQPTSWQKPNTDVEAWHGSCGIALETPKGITRWVVYEDADGVPEQFFETLFKLLKLGIGEKHND